MAEIAVGEPDFFRAKEQGDSAGLRIDDCPRFFQPLQWMLDLAMAHRRRSHNKSAVSHGVSNARELLGLRYHLGSAHRGAHFPKCNIIRIHDSQACEPKIAHRPGHRTDIQRIAWAYQHDAQTRMDVFGQGLVSYCFVWIASRLLRRPYYSQSCSSSAVVQRRVRWWALCGAGCEIP